MPPRFLRLSRKFWRSFLALIGEVSNLFLRFLFYPLQRNIKTKAGFVLPTATLVLLVVSLLVGTLVIRTGQEAEEAISEQAQQEIFNAATPAVDRAKAKIEFLFRDDPRFPVGIPSEIFLSSMMLNDGEEVDALDEDRYTFGDETRLDINGDDNLDNAWSYSTTNGETIAYSINLLTENNDINFQDKDEDKAKNLVVRSGPLNASSSSQAQSCAELTRLNIDNDWFTVTGSTVRKNFQIDAVATNNSDVNPTVSTIEVQQDRQLEFGNKWGAWFRYDMEFTPGPEFNWNGAIHTEGSFIVNNNGGGNTTRLRLVSSPESCFYTEEASDITVAEIQDDNGNTVYQGQVMRADTDNDQFQNDGDVEVDIFPGTGEAPSNDTNTLELDLTQAEDSVDPDNNDNPSLFYLDPVRLISEDISRARNPDDDSNTNVRDENWEDNPIRDRIFNQNARQPYVDDTYRADDRWGPKPQYTDDLNVTAANNGTLITGEPRLTDNPSSNDAENAGLDGYWERRANSEGLRIIVGQRLNLGNTNGWEGNNDDSKDDDDSKYDPLYDNDPEEDYLAAVQAGAVYHWENHDTSTTDPEPEPVACLALTGHQNGGDDTTFREIDIDGTTFLETNFLEGVGTNGWEFPFPDDFRTNIDDDTSDLYLALRNLAHFAGDPDGAFPPVQENGGDITHPFPELAMWGNFSNLRRIMNERLENGDNYKDLSIAEKTTLQTATCSLGMLAYNVDFLQSKQAEVDESETIIEDKLDEFTDLNWNPIGNQLVNSIGSKGGNPIIGKDGKVCKSTGEGLDQDGCPETNPNEIDDIDNPLSYTNYFNQFSIEDWITFIKNGGVSNSKKRIEEVSNLLEVFKDNLPKESATELATIRRDRELGFRTGFGTQFGSDTDNFDPETGIYTVPSSLGQVKKGNSYKMGCDPESSNFGFDKLEKIGNKRARFALSLIVCSSLSLPEEPRYPSLYYLFPVEEHDHDGDGSQPSDERYIASSYIADINDGYNYQVVDIDNLILQPEDFDDFELPTASSGINQITLPDDSTPSVSLLDKAFYNHRENMTVRVLDIDLDLLRANRVADDSDNDFWLPTGEENSGIVYAFREDAIREDAIARPRNNDWDDCNDEQEITGIDMTTGNVLSDLSTSDDCRMRPSVPQDPPLSDVTGVSVKPVDGYADPDRRPYGFRLRNGSELVRGEFKSSSSENDPTGLSFITDQPLYIQGNFNEHTEEEFTDSGSNFYERSNLNEDFATPNGESWRTAEIIADGITLLSESDNFEQVDQNGTNDNPGSNGNVEVNAILISGLEPTQPGKYNGGIHNFPRFLEDWGTVTIRGSFIQLNFSSYSTGPFDQENLDSENPRSLNAGVRLPYYGAPTRNWGYDVGLQYKPPGPVAERFVTPSNARTETYRELSVDDPYIENLLNAINDDD